MIPKQTTTMAQQNIDKFVSETQNLFVLPILEVPLKHMTETQLRHFLPKMLMYSMGRAELDWNDGSKQPPWWPSEVLWANIWTDENSDNFIQTSKYVTDVLQKIVISCYKYHGREDLLSIAEEITLRTSDLRESRNPLSSMDQTTEFNMICRLCLGNATSAVIDIFSCYNDEEIASIVSQHFWFQIFKGDGQSDRLCTNCWVTIERFHRFYKEVLQIHNSLPEDYGKTQQIKQEKEEHITDVASETELDEQMSNIYDSYEMMGDDPLTPKVEKMFETDEDNQILYIERNDTDWNNDNNTHHVENALLSKSCEKTPNETLPDKSSNRYKSTYDVFVKWQKSKKLTSFAEPVLLTYFSQLSMKYKPSTMWSTFSMLKSTLNLNHKVDISRYKRLLAFLKQKGDGFQSKKSELFTAEQVNTFMMEAPDDKYLAMKIVLAFGLIGGYRGDELNYVKTDYVKDNGNEIILRIPDSKTKVVKAHSIDGQLEEIVRKYMKLRPSRTETDRFFLRYQNGKCSTQHVGINNISKFPKEIARFLKLPESESYTGNSFRRTSKMLSEPFGGMEILKRYGQSMKREK